MLKYLVNLNDINKVKDFCLAASSMSGDVTVRSGVYVVDGKSIMGLFSLNLSKDVTVEMSDNELSSDMKKFMDSFGVKLCTH